MESKIYVKDRITKVQGNAVGDVVDNGIEKWVYVSDHTKSILLNFEHHFPLKITFDDHKYRTVSEGMTYVIKLVEDDSASTSANVASNRPVSSPSSGAAPAATSTSGILEEAKKAYEAEDDVKAIELFRKIDWDKEAQNYIGNMYAHGWGVAKDEAEAVRWYRKAAEQGDTLAKTFLESMGY